MNKQNLTIKNLVSWKLSKNKIMISDKKSTVFLKHYYLWALSQYLNINNHLIKILINWIRCPSIPKIISFKKLLTLHYKDKKSSNRILCKRTKTLSIKSFKKLPNILSLMTTITLLNHIFNTSIHKMVHMETLINKIKNHHFSYIKILIILKIKIYQTQRR